MITKAYHYLYYCYYNLINAKADHREDGASGLLSLLLTSILIAVYFYFNILFQRKTYLPALEGFLIFLVGIILAVLNWLYFVKKKKHMIAVKDFVGSPRYLGLIVGILLLILPFALFVFSGIKMGNYIRSIR
jgi:hypothetical protein